MDRQEAIIKQAVGLDYSQFETEHGFDYDKLMASVLIHWKKCVPSSKRWKSGIPRLIVKRRISRSLCARAPKRAKHARIFIKDERRTRRAALKPPRKLSVYEAKRLGYKGVVAATSGNYGAAVAAMVAKLGLDCIVVQECYDSRGVGQPGNPRKTARL